MGNKKVKRFAILAGFSMFEKIMAFFFQALIAAVFGAGIVTDCYYSATQLFDLINVTFLGAITIGLLNRFLFISNREGTDKAFSFTSNVFSWSVLIMALISVFIFIFAKECSLLIAPGIKEEYRPLLVKAIRLLTILPILTTISAVSEAILRINEHYIIINSRSLCLSVFGISAVLFSLLFDNVSIYPLCIAYVISTLTYSLCNYFMVKKHGTIKVTIPRYDNDIKSLLFLVFPTIISNGIIRLSLIVDQIISSTFEEGSISCLSYAQSLYNVVSSILIVNLGMILLTDFSTLYINNDMEGIIKRIKNAIHSISLLLIPVTLISVLFSKEIVMIVFNRGAFDIKASQKVADLLLYYAIGFIPAMINSVYTQVLYAFGKMKTAMTISLVTLIINIISSAVLAKVIGFEGIAIGTSLSVFCGVFINNSEIRKNIKSYHLAYSKPFIVKASIASLAMLVTISTMKSFISNIYISFLLGVIMGGLVFFSALYVLQENYCRKYVTDFFNRGKQ